MSQTRARSAEFSLNANCKKCLKISKYIKLYIGQDGNNVGPYVERQGSMAIDFIDPDFLYCHKLFIFLFSLYWHNVLFARVFDPDPVFEMMSDPDHL